MDGSPPGSSVHGILQARIPERVAIPFSRKMTLECKIMKYTHRHDKMDPFLIAQLVKNLPAMQEPGFNPWVGKICWRRERLHTPVFLGFPGGSAGKESACNVVDLGSIPGSGRHPGEGKGHALQYSGLENCMDCEVHGVSKCRTRLSKFHFHVFLGPKCLVSSSAHFFPQSLFFKHFLFYLLSDSTE